MDEKFRLIFGTILILVGIIWIWIGDRKIPVKGGVVLGLFSMPEGHMRWLKWPMGIVMIYAGLATIFHF